MSNTRKILIGIGALVVVVIIAAGLSVYLMTRSTDIEEEMRPVDPGDEDVRSLDRKLAELEDEIRILAEEGRTGEVTLVLSEAEVSILLTEMMKDAMAESPQGFSEGKILNTRVNLDNEYLQAVVEMEVYGVPIHAGARVQGVVKETGLSLELQSIQVGQFPFAGYIEGRIKQTFDESLTDIGFSDLHVDLDHNLPVELIDITIREKEMVVTGRVT